MATKGMDRTLISVSNLENSLALYRDWIGMKVVAEQTLAPNEIQQLWNLPRETKARAVFLKNELQPTLLELVEFKPHSGRTIRERKSWDYGLWAISFWVKDIDAVYNGLTEKGYTFVCPPFFYEPDWLTYAVKEVVLIAPDNVTIGHYQKMTSGPYELTIGREKKLTPEEYEAQGNYIKFDHSAQYVEGLSEAVKFYRDILGLDLGGELTVAEGLLDELLEVPPGTEVKTALMHKEDEDSLLIQFLQLSVKGKSLASVARPPNLGVFMISFEVDGLSSVMEKFKKEGIPILSGPVELHTKLHGKMRAITVEGPNGEMIELFER